MNTKKTTIDGIEFNIEECRKEWLKNITLEEVAEIDNFMEMNAKNAISYNVKCKKEFIFAIVFLLLALVSLYLLVPMAFTLIRAAIFRHNQKVSEQLYFSHKQDKDDYLKRFK